MPETRLDFLVSPLFNKLLLSLLHSLEELRLHLVCKPLQEGVLFLFGLGLGLGLGEFGMFPRVIVMVTVTVEG